MVSCNRRGEKLPERGTQALSRVRMHLYCEFP